MWHFFSDWTIGCSDMHFINSVRRFRGRDNFSCRFRNEHNKSDHKMEMLTENPDINPENSFGSICVWHWGIFVSSLNSFMVKAT